MASDIMHTAWYFLAVIIVLTTWATFNERNQIDCLRAGGTWQVGILNDYCVGPRK